MKPLLLAALLTVPLAVEAQALKLVGTPERVWTSSALPVQSGEHVVMEMLLMPGSDPTSLGAQLVQIGGVVAAPLNVPVTLETSPRDARLCLVRFTAPEVARITRLLLRLSDQTIWSIVVFPPAAKAADRPDLTHLLKSSRRQLLVCGRSPELRDHLDSLGLRYEDVGPDAPRRLRDDEILLGELPDPDDWRRLTAPDTTGQLIVAVDDPALLPGVHVTTRADGVVCKLTLPLFPLLADNPQARETLFQLLLTALTPAVR